MRSIIALLIFFTALLSAGRYATAKEGNYLLQKPKHVSDDQLRERAIERYIIPWNADEAYFREAVEQENSIAVWMMLGRKEKLELVTGMIARYAQNNVTIKRPPGFYVDAMNAVLYQCMEGEPFEENTRGYIRILFDTTAILYGDFDNGTDKVEMVRKLLGEDQFEEYKQIFRDTYEALRKEEKTGKPH
ncbi:MAG: hypothetical protein C4540_06725 [Candidatus Omnitrophota bacterium]|nr:MAG: hypothetical protein C4540_06725 [Candidatus Omnitrophota bacterium]